MGRFSDTIANAALDAILGDGSPATVYVALSLSVPANDGTNVTEPSGGSYARVAVTNNSTNWPDAVARSKSNGNAIVYPTATADWGDITDFALYDASTAGTFMGWGALDTLATINTGSTPSFPAGSLVVNAPGS